MNQSVLRAFTGLPVFPPSLAAQLAAIDALGRTNHDALLKQIAGLNARMPYQDAIQSISQTLLEAQRQVSRIAEQAAYPKSFYYAMRSVAETLASQAPQWTNFHSLAQQIADATSPYTAAMAEVAKATALAEPFLRYAQISAPASAVMDYPALRDLLADAGYDKLEEAASEAAVRLDQQRASIHSAPQTLPQVRVVLAEADLTELKAALREVIDEALTRMIRALQPKTRKQWSVVLQVVGTILVATYSIVGQPLFQRMLEQRDHDRQKGRSDPSLSALSQLSLVTPESAMVRLGPHTQQRYLGTVHRGDIVRVIRARGRWRLILVSARDKGGDVYSGWVKANQLSPLQTQAADLLSDSDAVQDK